MFAAGVEFIPEEGNKGVGVRFRERKLEFVSNVRIDRFNRRATMRMRYASEDFLCHIELDAIDDYHRSNFRTDEEFGQAISSIQHIVLAAAERNAATDIRNGEMLVDYEMLAGSK